MNFHLKQLAVEFKAFIGELMQDYNFPGVMHIAACWVTYSNWCHTLWHA